ncbi:prepilin-type N-terminal cleavage/methylation domain-containing protein, partial [Vibrio lentus]
MKRQNGFTLLELIIAVLILAILSATAMVKFL